MKNETITTPNFTGSIARTIAKIRASTCIDEADEEFIAKILQDELTEQYRMLDEYYEEEYYNALSRARNSAYDEGFNDGYDVGYDNGYDDWHAKKHSAV